MTTPSPPDVSAPIEPPGNRTQAAARPARVRDDQGRLAVLGETGALLSSSHDAAALLERLAGLVVPRLADGLVLVERGGGRESEARVAHRDGARLAELRSAAGRWATEPGLLAEVLRTGESRLQQVQDAGRLDRSAGDGEHRQPLAGLGARSLLAVAVVGRGETLGAMVLVSHDPELVFDEADLRAAEQLGRQVGAALVGARPSGAEALARLEAEAHGSERRFRAVADTMPQLVWTTRADGYHEYYNRRWYDYTGMTPAQSQGEGWSTVLHPDDLAHTQSVWASCLATGQPYEIEYRLRGADGVYRWFLGRALPLRDESGVIRQWFGTCTEIDAQRRASDAQRLLSAVTSELVGSLDLEGTLRGVARRVVPDVADWCAIDLLTERGTLERVEAAHVDPAKVEMAWRLWREFPPDLDAPGGVAEVIRSQRPQRTREITPAMLAQAPLPEAQRRGLLALGLRSSLVVPLVARGRVLGALTLVTAESERLFEEPDEAFALELAARLAIAVDNAGLIERLRVNERRYRSLVDASLQTVWTNTPEGEMAGEQPGWAALTGQAPPQYRGFGWSEAIHPDDRAATVAAWQRAVATRTPYAVEHRVRVSDGSYRDFTARGVPVLDDDGRVSEWVGVHTDVTARKATERERERLIEALARSNQELDQFAYIASHDLKAPLRGIANLSHWIEDDLGGVLTDETREHMRLLRGRVQRLEALIEGILRYSRAVRGQEPSERVDTGQVVRDVVELLSPPATVTWRIAPDLPAIESEKVPLQQVLMNLVSNALKYAGPSATIAVEARDRGPMVEFAVTDDGPGIEPRFHERIWGIFQTLAPRDRVESTGIGLAVVKKVVEAHGGQVGLRSAEGQGATFTFTWPRAPLPR